MEPKNEMIGRRGAVPGNGSIPILYYKKYYTGQNSEIYMNIIGVGTGGAQGAHVPTTYQQFTLN